MCANLCSGIRFGVGAMFERTCSRLECGKCTVSPFDRDCRFFHFRPHYTVQLVKIDPSGPQVSFLLNLFKYWIASNERRLITILITDSDQILYTFRFQ